MGFFSTKKSTAAPAATTSAKQAKLQHVRQQAAIAASAAARATPASRNAGTVSSNAEPLLVERNGSDEEMVVIERSPHKPQAEKKQTAPANLDLLTTTDDSAEGSVVKSPSSMTDDSMKHDGSASYYTHPEIEQQQSEDTVYSVIQVRPLSNPEPIVNGSLIQWKFAAEEGPVPLRIVGVASAIAMIVTSVLPYCLDTSNITVSHIIISLFTFLAGIQICILDGRFSFVRNPLGCRAKMRNTITRHFNVMKLIWGRGVLYIIAGCLHISQMWIMTWISGGIMIGVGIIAVFLGVHASRNLMKLRSSLTNEDFLWLEFSRFDIGNNGYLDPNGFSHFLWEIGLEFDDLYTLKAFNAIDLDGDRKITFEQFKQWWSQCMLDTTRPVSELV